MTEEKAIDRCNELIKSEHANWIGIYNQNAIKTVLNMLKEKDKEIDLMAETIRKLAISLANYRGSYNEETIHFTGNIKDLKQYFKRKATNDG